MDRPAKSLENKKCPTRILFQMGRLCPLVAVVAPLFYVLTRFAPGLRCSCCPAMASLPSARPCIVACAVDLPHCTGRAKSEKGRKAALPVEMAQFLAAFLGMMTKNYANQEVEVVKKITAFALQTVLPARQQGIARAEAAGDGGGIGLKSVVKPPGQVAERCRRRRFRRGTLRCCGWRPVAPGYCP